MTTYALIRLLHVQIAVLAMGLVTAGAILSRPSSGVPAVALRPVVRWATGGFVLMIASGVALDTFVAGALHRTTWFRAGVALAIAAGVAVGISRRVITSAIAGRLDAERARRRLSLALWTAFAFIAAAVIVMVVRP